MWLLDTLEYIYDRETPIVIVTRNINFPHFFFLFRCFFQYAVVSSILKLVIHVLSDVF